MCKQLKVFPPLPTVTRGRCCKIDCFNGEEIILAYCNSSNVFIRNLNKKESIVFSEHRSNVLVARFSPCGTMMASGDAQGNLFIWDVEKTATKQGKPVILNQKLWSGQIYDIAWKDDGNSVFVVGSGSIVLDIKRQVAIGSVNIHSRPVNCVSWKPGTNEACTGSDDYSVALFAGAPITFHKTLNVHTNFVQQVAFSPSGDKLVSVGSDKKIVVHNLNSKNGEPSNAPISQTSCHEGTVFGVAWIDENQFLTCSADKSIKFWSLKEDRINLETKLDLDTQILGLVMHPKSNKCILVTLNSTLVVVDVKGFKIDYEITGHTTSLTQMFFHQNHLYSLDKDGWLCEDGDKRIIQLEEYSYVCMNEFNIASLLSDNLVLYSKLKKIKQIGEVGSISHYKSDLWIFSNTKNALQCINFDTFEQKNSHSIKEQAHIMA